MKRITRKENKGLALRNSKGFTLIELLVVVAIIAILALIVMLAINPVEMARRSRDSRRLSDVATLRKAIDLALADGESLPVVDWTSLDSTVSVTLFPTGAAGGANISKYLSVVPTDPQYETTGTLQLVKNDCSVETGVNKSTMRYQIKSDGSVYVLRARLESEDNCNAVSQDGETTDDTYRIGTAPGLTL